MINPVLRAIKKRRSVKRFETTLIAEKKIQAILEAGGWAPSWLNKQPWRFILIRDQSIKERISEFVPTIFNKGVLDAPICIAVCVDPGEDPYHYIEDGAAATQNMALAAHSLGLGSIWIGVFDLKGEKNSAEEKIKEILEVPKNWRLISIMPIGVPKFVPEKSREKLSQIVYRDYT
jgi:nitroreductase